MGGHLWFGPLGVFHMCYFGHLLYIAQSVCFLLFHFFLHVWVWDKSVNSASLSLSGLADADENCKRFMDRCMPEAFKKVNNENPES